MTYPGKSNVSNMQEKQKVTLYLPLGLHRQLKIRAAIDAESMSAMVEKAIAFYLEHPEKVEEVQQGHGKTHQVHICPECQAAMVIREGQMTSLKNQPTVLGDELPLEIREKVKSEANSAEELVPC
jgi:hypothetical protein